MNTFVWPHQWYEVSPQNRAILERELSHEISPGHVLFGRSVCAIARREDCDDVLFAMVGSLQVAVVHLVYGSMELQPGWPATMLYESRSVWQKEQTDD